MDRVKSLEQVNLPDGKYDGLWSGWTVKVLLPNRIETDDIKVDGGVRGIRCKCEIEIINGWLYID